MNGVTYRGTFFQNTVPTLRLFNLQSADVGFILFYTCAVSHLSLSNLVKGGYTEMDQKVDLFC